MHYGRKGHFPSCSEKQGFLTRVQGLNQIAKVKKKAFTGSDRVQWDSRTGLFSITRLKMEDKGQYKVQNQDEEKSYSVYQLTVYNQTKTEEFNFTSSCLAANPTSNSTFTGNPMAVIGPGVGAGIGVLFILLGIFIYLRKRRGISKTEDLTADVSSADSNHGDCTTQKETQIQQLEQTEATDEDIYANSTYSPPKKPKAAAPRVTQTQIQQLEQTEAADEDIYANSTYCPPKKPKAAAPRVTQVR
ncbi:hypothetical protein AGOR_G00194880 [Albula goreensis]|uniref:Uncharacterized protein n=1 Tax=Albula goreensis TaxID=1534307 RepID=A0A8T3CRQ6_9TELE|nr:hypothetical protein AGOR_G00194880 [Albula goreensis]